MPTFTLPALGRVVEAEQLLAGLRDLLPREQHAPDLERYIRVLEYNLAMRRGERAQALAAVESLATAGWHGDADIGFLALGDTRATDHLQAATPPGPPFLRVHYLGAAQLHLSDEHRQDPRVRRMFEAVGFTPEWRLEFCRHIAAYPPEYGPRCDPRKYELDKETRELANAGSADHGDG